MSKFIYQYGDAQQWVGANHLFVDTASFINFLKSALTQNNAHEAATPEEIVQLTECLKKSETIAKEIKALVKKTKGVASVGLASESDYYHTSPLYICVPKKRSSTKIESSYMSSSGSLSSDIELYQPIFQKFTALYSLFLGARAISYKILKHSNPHFKGSQSHEPFMKNIAQASDHFKFLLSEIEKNNITCVERSTENGFIQKKSWAIFATLNDYSGYKSKAGSLGEISSAQLFDSDLGAKRAANLMFTQYEIVEVEIALKARTYLNPNYQSDTLTSALAILEKQKIEQFFNEVSLDKITQKIDEMKSANLEKPSSVKRNKI